MRISACSIVKNEEKNIARSIESYRRVVDEIIIVDTGSTDNTVAICEKLGATVLHYEWHNDFAAAKNFALDHATGDWVIFLDADEWFVPTLTDDRLANVIKQAEEVSDNRIELLRLMLCNIEEKTGVITSKTAVGRVFKHKDEIRYEGSIHEDIKNAGKPVLSAKVDELEVYHSGYSQAIVKEKSIRNLEMLYDKYKKGEGDAGIYFYLCRENSILGKTEEALKFYHLFLKSENIDEIIKAANVYVSIYEFGIKLMKNQRDQYTSQDIKAAIETAIEKYPQLPMHYYLMGCYYFEFDYDQALVYFEKAVKMNKDYKGEYINNLVTSVIDAYLKMACIYKAHQDNMKALDIIIEAVKVEPLDKHIFAMLMSLIKNQTPVDIILFLSRFYDIKNEEHVTFLTKELMWTKCHEVFLYFAKRYNQEFMQEDETTYIAMLLTNNAKEVIRVGMEAYYNGGKDDDRYFAALAMMLGKDKDAFDHYKMSLNRPYATVVQRFIEGNKISNPTVEELQAWQHFYGHMYYLASTEELKRYEDIFEKMPAAIVPTIISNMLADEDYQKIKETGQRLVDNIEDIQIQAEVKKVMSYEIYFSKEFDDAIDAFEETCINKEIDCDLRTLHYLQYIAKNSESFRIRNKANKLYENYSNKLLQEREIEEAVRTEKIEEIKCKYKSLDKTSLSQEAFEELLSDEHRELKANTVKQVFVLMEKYTDKGMEDKAFEMLMFMLQNDYKKDIAYYRLGELFNRINNNSMALYCHKMVFKENALFAETLLGEKAKEDAGYRYHEIDTEDRTKCPLCGEIGTLDGVYNTLLSEDYSVQYPPFKIWRYCPECHHIFTENVPTHLSDINDESLNLVEKKTGEQIKALEGTFEYIGKYQAQGRLLDVNVSNPALMLLAEEYGYDVKGLAVSHELAEVLSHNYALDVQMDNVGRYVDEKKYNVISMVNELEQELEPIEVIKKAYDLLETEGILYIRTPNNKSAAARYLKDKGIVYRQVKTVQYFSKESLKKLLENNGFEVVAYRAVKQPMGYMEIIARK